MSFLGTFWKCGEESVRQQGRYQPVAQLVAVRLLLEAEAEPPRWTVQFEIPCVPGDVLDGMLQKVGPLFLGQGLLHEVTQSVEDGIVFPIVIRIEANIAQLMQLLHYFENQIQRARLLNLGQFLLDIGPPW